MCKKTNHEAEERNTKTKEYIYIQEFPSYCESTADILNHYKPVRKIRKVDTNVHGTIISF